MNSVLCAMTPGVRYLPEDIEVGLKTSTVSQYLRELYRGGMVEREVIDMPNIQDGRKSKRIFYSSLQLELCLSGS